MALNDAQKTILRHSAISFAAFVSEEWRGLFTGYALGVLAGTLLLSSNNATWIPSLDLSSKYKELAKQVPDYWYILGPLLAICLWEAFRLTRRVFRSLSHAVARGTLVLSFTSATAISALRGVATPRREIEGFICCCVLLLLSFAIDLASRLARERTPPARVSKKKFQHESLDNNRDPDSPIESWVEDRLGRAPLVEILADKILVSKAPVIAVRGGFGDGKSSVLNLLRKELERTAIVISFSSWLPDSQRMLVQDLFGDIASECNRAFIIPGLRKRLTKFAAIIAGTTPQLKVLPDLLPTYTQRQEIRDLGKSLGRLPKRVVVLLDEIDRMEKDEVLTLLKVIRGGHILPNLTFVCALNQNHVERLTQNSFDTDPHEFFEKFFPVAFDLPKPSPETLKKMLCDRTLEAFQGAHWFHDAEERKTFLDGVTELWNAALNLICSNIRKVNLLASDIHGASLLACREVNALDLCALEALRRFFPAVYELIWRKAQFFSMSYEWWKTREHRTDAFLVQECDNIGTQIREAAKGDRDVAAIRALLTAMFPDRVKELYSERPPSSKLDTTRLAELERGKRIAHPDYLPVYFRYEVPDAIFSSREMTEFMTRMSSAKSQDERRKVFDDAFSSLQDGSVRRYDFIHKLVSELGTVDENIAKSIALSLAANAHGLGDDFLVSEGRRARAAVLTVAQLLSHSDEINAFIMEVILSAGTDMFAAQTCRSLTTAKDNEILLNYDHVDKRKIQETFATRMNLRYGEEADVSNVDPRALTSHPFYIWSTISDEDRRKEIVFWERFIGRDRAKLAEAFNIVAPIDEFWTHDTPATIDQMIPMDMLRSLFERSTALTPVDERHEKSLSRLKTFLDQQAADGSATA